MARKSATDATSRNLEGLDFDQAVTRLVEQAREVLSAQNRLRSLLHATEAIVSELSLPVVLRGIVEAACELVGAPFGALGVLAPDGTGLEQFIHVGIPQAEADKIGHLPQGKGLLGALIDDPQTVRLTDLTTDFRSVGFPDHHPPMRSFLGTPIRVREEIFGNLYLANIGGTEFSAEDEQLISALAATAGVAIANARLYEEAERRQQWLQASTETTRDILTRPVIDPLRSMTETVLRLADADVVTITVPSDDEIEVVVAAGTRADELQSTRYPRNRTFAGHVLESGEPVLLQNATAAEEVAGRIVHVASVLPVGPLMAIPLMTATGARGAMTVARRTDRRPFTPVDMEMATTFVTHAAIALELAEARQLQEQRLLVDDQERIATDLHEHVIDQLFAVGMRLTSLRPTIDARAATIVGELITNLDDAIHQIRGTLFGLTPSKGQHTTQAHNSPREGE